MTLTTQQAPQWLHSTTGSTFEIGRGLGQGGMGYVYLAQRRDLAAKRNELVALKMLRPSAPEQARRLFYREGALLPRLQHPNIVRLIERGRGALGTGGAVDYLTLEYVAGQTIEDVLRRSQRPLPLDALLGMLAQLTSALDYLHQRGVVHCDLKPSNIMVEHAAPRVVLLDFGIARAPDFVGQLAAVGTPEYMAPEQADAQAACDGRADIYALGILLYECLTAKRLFPSRSTADIRTGKAVTVDREALAATVAPALAVVIAQCLSRLPEDRYATASQVFEGLCSAAQALLPPAPGGGER